MFYLIVNFHKWRINFRLVYSKSIIKICDFVHFSSGSHLKVHRTPSFQRLLQKILNSSAIVLDEICLLRKRNFVDISAIAKFIVLVVTIHHFRKNRLCHEYRHIKRMIYRVYLKYLTKFRRMIVLIKTNNKWNGTWGRKRRLEGENHDNSTTNVQIETRKERTSKTTENYLLYRKGTKQLVLP